MNIIIRASPSVAARTYIHLRIHLCILDDDLVSVLIPVTCDTTVLAVVVGCSHEGIGQVDRIHISVIQYLTAL